MEKHIGRHIKKDEVVHHKDENPLNNSIENLELISNISHKKLHTKKRRRDNGGRFIKMS